MARNDSGLSISEFLRSILLYVLTLFAGGIVALAIAGLVSLFARWLAGWVFLGLMGWWMWLGWVHSGRRDAARRALRDRQSEADGSMEG